MNDIFKVEKRIKASFYQRLFKKEATLNAFIGGVYNCYEPIVAINPTIKLAGMNSNLLVDRRFKGPIRLAAGITKVLGLKNSKAVLGIPFAEAAARAIAEKFTKREIQQNGFLYNEEETRPAKGAFTIVSEDDVEEMLDVLRNLGLKKFEDSTPVDFFIKPVVNLKEDHIAPATVESDLVFQMPKNFGGKVQMISRVMVMDPMFIDEKGQNLYLTKMPEKYIEAILNTLNPAVIFSALGPKQLDELFGRAGKFEGAFKANFAEAVKKWRNQPAPKDFKTMQLWIKLLLLHEFTHALALNLPDVIPPNLPGDEQSRLNQFSVSAYINLLNSSRELHSSVVYTKNLIKALQAVEGQPVNPVTQNRVVRVLALEMFCDRFSMHMFETFRKLQAYSEAMPDMGEITVDTMRHLEKQRVGNPKGFKSMNELTDSAMATLAEKLKAAETEHVYISSFHDPVISNAERAIFDPFLDLLRRFDREKTIQLYTEEHTIGDFFKASQNGSFISENKAGVDHVVQIKSELYTLKEPTGLVMIDDKNYKTRKL